ncbi:MAG TPA: response regulator [Rudaea sp.]
MKAAPEVSKERTDNARVLLVEDDPALGMVTVEVLHQLGYRVDWSSSADEAQSALARDESFDVMILDLGLGQSHGVELIDAIRTHGYRIPPIVIFSAQPVDSLRHAAVATAAVAILQKPCSASQLEHRVQTALRSAAPSGVHA